MTVIFQPSYSLPGVDQPLTHARIAHALNWYSGTASASSTDADYFTAAPNNSLTYESWKPDALAAWWELNLGSSQQVDYCAIGGHTLGDNGNNLEVQYFDGTDWVSLNDTAIADNSAIFVIFEPITAQRWRIRVRFGTAPKISVIRFGKAMQLSQPIFGGHAPVAFGRVTDIRAPRSVSGEFLGWFIERRGLEASYEWTHLKNSWIRAYWGDFQKAVEGDPIFIAWRPGDYGDCVYGSIEAPPIPSNMGVRDFMQVGFKLTGLTND